MLVTQVKDAYMVLGYACNQHCACCPCSEDQGEDARYPLKQLMAEIDRLESLGITDVTISGGEPTIHPDFLTVVSEFIRRGIVVHILSNGDRFHDRDFADRFLAIASGHDVSVTTTFHSQDPAEHEGQNLTPGSFARSLAGLRYLDSKGLNVSIKHCITGCNVKDLKEYLHFVTDSFSPRTEIQLWGIDVCGVSPEVSDTMFVPFREIGRVLEEALLDFEQRCGTSRILNINNIPLCSCDCYFWKYFTAPRSHGYLDYLRSDDGELKRNSGPLSAHCRSCPFAGQCLGAYASVFERYGDDVVQVPALERALTTLPTVYSCYDGANLDRLYFSPYLFCDLTPRGMTLSSRLTGQSVNLNLFGRDLEQVRQMFTEGVTDAEAEQRLSRMYGVRDPRQLLDTMLAKGVLE